MKRALALLLMLITVHAHAQMKPFKSAEGGFEVMTPVQLKREESKADARGPRILMFAGMDGAVRFAAGYFDLTKDQLQQLQAGDFFSALENSTAKKEGGKVIQESKVMLGPFEGREFSIDGEKNTFRGRVFAVNNRYYLISVKAYGKADATHAEEFLKSFKLISE